MGHGNFIFVIRLAWLTVDPGKDAGTWKEKEYLNRFQVLWSLCERAEDVCPGVCCAGAMDQGMTIEVQGTRPQK